MLGEALEQVRHHTFLDELARDLRRSQFGQVEVVSVKGHADHADAIEEPGDLNRRGRGGCRVGDLRQVPASEYPM